MGFMTSLFGSRATPENPSFDLNSEEAWGALEANKSDTGESVNLSTSLQYSPVWRATNLISRDVAKLPVLIYKRVGEGKERATDHPAYRLLRRKPNAEMTSFVFRQTMMGHVLLEGNAYAYITRDGAGRPIELIPLMPNETYPVRENGRLWYVTSVGGSLRKLDASSVLHFKGLGYDGLCGYSVIQVAKQSLGLGMAVSKFGRILFKNNARPSVVLEHPGKLEQSAVQELRQSWERMHQGLDNAHRTAILTNGMKAHILSFNAEDSQFLQTRQFEIREVANWFGVPPHKLGDTTRTAFASLEQENQAYLDEALDGWLVVIEEETYEKLLSEEEKDGDTHVIEFMRQALVRADMTTRFAAYATAINNRFMSPNEARSRENLNPYDGGDEFLVPLNVGGPVAGDDTEEEEPPEGEESEDQEDQEAERKRRQAASEVVTDVVRRMVRRVNVHAARASKNPKPYMDFVSNIDSDHGSVIQEACKPAESAMRSLAKIDKESRLADWLIGSLCGSWCSVADSATPSTLAQVVSDRAKVLEETLPSKAVITFFGEAS